MITPMPHVENTAVVTARASAAAHTKRASSQWPGMALRRAISAILNPPSRTTCARHAYESFVRSSFSPRTEQQYLNALRGVRRAPMHESEHSLEVAEFAEERARCDDPEAGPEAPHEAAQDGDDFVAEELPRRQWMRDGK